MNERRKIEEKVRKKEQEIQNLETQIKDARIYLQALQDVLKMLPKDSGAAGDSPPSLRVGSAAASAREVILRHGEPLHIAALLQAMGKEMTRDNRSALAGTLAAYVRRGEVFTRPAPNCFGLVELGEAGSRMKSLAPEGPPADFGDILDDDDPPF